MWRRPVVAGVALLVAYVGLSFLNSPRGFLGTDTGGKVATLDVMTDGPGLSLDPDLGYWAERWDPDGSIYPLYFTSRLGDRWVNVTTLPMLFLAAPLYDAGGYRAALLLPMLGAVAAAFAARAMARRLGAGASDAWRTFWVVGLASPLTIYALDFWEHTVGVALMAWAIVLLWDVVASDGRRWQRAAAAGALFGLSFTVRTETLVYLAVSGAVVGAVLLFGRSGGDRRNMLRPAHPGFLGLGGASALAAFGAVAYANELLERAVLKQGIRSARATGVATLAGDAPADRVTEAAYNLVGAAGSDRGVVLGIAAIVLFGWGIVRSRSDARFGLLVMIGAAVVLALRFADGLGFVPGLFVAWPFAVAAVVLGGLRRWPAALGAIAIPLVIATQFRGGAAPQWAGRYVLTSGLLLTVAGAVVLGRAPRVVQRAVVVAAGVVTALGLAWLSVRSHDVDRAIATIERRSEPIIVSRIAHLAREGGATYGDRRWLTVDGYSEWEEAASVAAAAGEERLVLVELAQAQKPLEPPAGWSSDGSGDRVRLFSGVDLRLTTWERTDSR